MNWAEAAVLIIALLCATIVTVAMIAADSNNK